jgi:maleate isomerase
MLTPYPDEVTEAMRDCLSEAGIEVISCGSFHIENDYEIINVTPHSIIEAAEALNSSQSDALFIPCTGLRTSTIIDVLEARIGKPVITAHQAMLWDALRLGGYTRTLAGFGRLFAS